MILLCDEATSALDSRTEKQILQALQALAHGRTSLFVAHRLSTAAQCDQIVVLEGVSFLTQFTTQSVHQACALVFSKPHAGQLMPLHIHLGTACSMTNDAYPMQYVFWMEKPALPCNKVVLTLRCPYSAMIPQSECSGGFPIALSLQRE